MESWRPKQKQGSVSPPRHGNGILSRIRLIPRLKAYQRSFAFGASSERALVSGEQPHNARDARSCAGVVQALCRRGALYEEMYRTAKGGVVSIRLPKRNLGTVGPLRTHPKGNYCIIRHLQLDSTCCCLRVPPPLADRPRLGGEASCKLRAVSR
jgi:hypothetical protein